MGYHESKDVGQVVVVGVWEERVNESNYEDESEKRDEEVRDEGYGALILVQ